MSNNIGIIHEVGDYYPTRELTEEQKAQYEQQLKKEKEPINDEEKR